MSDYDHIFLSPICDEATGEGRLWCQHDNGPCEDCGDPWTKYVRADLFDGLQAEVKVLREALEFYGDESGWNEPPVQTVNHEIFGKAYQNQASKIRLDRGKTARTALSKSPSSDKGSV